MQTTVKQRVHEVKSWPAFFQPMWDGDMPFDCRLDDRGYQRGDLMIYREWCPDKKDYTGRVMKKEISYTLNWGMSPGHIAFGLKEYDPFQFDMPGHHNV